MIYGLRFVLGYVFGTDKAERNFAVYPDDTFIVSYPRSGNTWTRFLIANLMYPNESVSFGNIERLIPDTSSQSNRALKRTQRPRIIKTHQYFDHRYGKIVYIVRDPRDVALSYYDFHRKYRHISDDHPLETWVDDFVRGTLISSDWGSWGENVASWLYTRGQSPDFLLLRYEDMIKHTSHELARIARHFQIEVTPERLSRVVEECSVERMRELEKLEENEWVATRKHRKDIPFVRAAKARGWRSELPEPCVAKIESAWGNLMNTIGYELVSKPAQLTSAMSRQQEAPRV